MNKFSKAMVIGLSAAFLLAGCKKDGPANGNGGSPESSIDEARMLRQTFEVTTLDGRHLAVSATAYCEKLDDLSLESYTRECSAYVQKQLDYFAGDRECFEGALPAISPDVRNHPGLPQDKEFCYKHYPDNYASWTEDMMRRALDFKPKNNYYTVTAIQPL